MRGGTSKRMRLAGLIGAIGLGLLLSGVDRHPASATGYWSQWEVWGSYGKGQGQFDHPTGIAIDEAGDVYVADSGNKRIQKFDSDGRFLREWARSIPGKPGVDLRNPADIAFDAAGNMYISDTDDDIQSIKKIDANGIFVSTWRVDGIKGAAGITVNGAGNLIVINSKTMNGRLTEINPENGAVVRTYETGSGPNDFAAGRDVTVNASGNGKIYIADTNGNRIGAWSDETGFDDLHIWGIDDRGVRDPVSIAADAQGTLYIADRYNSRVVRTSEYGDYIEHWGGKGTSPGRFDGPNGVAVDKNGNVYVADTNNNRVQKLARKMNVSANELTPELRQAMNATTAAPPALTVVAGQPFSVVLAGFAARIPDGAYEGVAVAGSADGKYSTLSGTFDAEGIRVVTMNGLDVVFRVLPPPTAGSVEVSF